MRKENMRFSKNNKIRNSLKLQIFILQPKKETNGPIQKVSNNGAIL